MSILQGLNNNEVDLEQAWMTLSSALREMHTKNASELLFEQIYRLAYKVVLKRQGEILYNRLMEFETQWLRGQVKPDLLRQLSPNLVLNSQPNDSSTAPNERRTTGERFLKGLKSAFEDHQLVMNMATDVFMYLDRVYCVDSRKPSIYSAAMFLFRDEILQAKFQDTSMTMLELLTKVILDQVAMDRDGNLIDKSLIKACVAMLESLFEGQAEAEDEKLYLTSFEAHFLNASREFYDAEGTRLLQEQDAASYCKNTSRRIHEEINRCRSTLSESTTSKITTVLEDELITKRIRDLILMDSGVKYMIDNNRYGDLELVFELNSRIDSQKKELTDAIQKRVEEAGGQINDAAQNLALAQAQASDAQHGGEDGKSRLKLDQAINQQTEAAKHWVEQILTLKDQYDHLWRVSFQSDPIILPALTQSFTATINVFGRSSEYVSLFIDENMKKGLKDKTEDEVDKVLEKAIVLLRYIQDKDLFERYYKKHLSKRLLMHKSISIDFEKLMIQRMKLELGNSFTSKMEAMFRDMTLSEDLTNGFRERIATGSDSRRADLGIHVLTTTMWPLETMHSSSTEIESKNKCIYPPSIERIKHDFERYYAEKHSGRKLAWMSNMGTADIRAIFPSIPGKEGTSLGKERRYELNVSTHAMIILSLFNDVQPGAMLTFDEIQAVTNIETHELTRNLQSLAVAPKSRVLIKEPMSRDIKPDDKFGFNERFVSNFMRIKVGVVAAGNKIEAEKERKETERKNNDSRGYVIEATIVRIMK